MAPGAGQVATENAPTRLACACHPAPSGGAIRSQRSAARILWSAPGRPVPFSFSPKGEWSAPDLGFTRDRAYSCASRVNPTCGGARGLRGPSWADACDRTTPCAPDSGTGLRIPPRARAPRIRQVCEAHRPGAAPPGAPPDRPHANRVKGRPRRHCRAPTSCAIGWRVMTAPAALAIDMRDKSQ